MASNLQNPSSIFILACLVSSLLVNYSSALSLADLRSLPPIHFHHSRTSNAHPHHKSHGYVSALATWYGDPNGAGSGGACGWANDVQSPPFSAMIAAGNANLYLQGKGCGNCYEVKCTQKPYCSGRPIHVTITDECPGACNNVPFHFDLSGMAFGAMANPGHAKNLRNLGRVDIKFRRVRCNYGLTKIAFKINDHVNPYWFATAIEFGDGDGGLASVEIAAQGSKNFVPMSRNWGAVWQANIDPSFKGPFSFRLTAPTKEVVIARNAVPANFSPGGIYYSQVNF